MTQKQYDLMMERLDSIENRIKNLDGDAGCITWIVVLILLGMIFS